ncbi:MAG: hypothetical protein M3401_12210 [Actinomycetota bacterium]|nr:hypothetical protein [Actinomycetota bacterium]
MRGAAPAWATTLAVSAVLLAACGEDDAPRSSTTTTAADARAIELTIRYDDATRIASGRVICRSGEQRATGDLAVRLPTSALCRDVRSLTRLLTKKPGRRTCTARYGGPQTVRVTGTIDGRTVDRRFGRTNGCEIADFARLTPILPLER